MSFSCPFDGDVSSASVPMPCEQDLVVNILRDLLGDNYVNAFLINNKSPALATLVEPTVLSMTLSLLASVAITAAILIFVTSIYKWVTESANDGEAVGLSERGGILGMFGRPFFALALLVPTASGYPTINLIIMTVILWANGATNQLYKTVSEKQVNVVNVDSSFRDSETFKQANDVTDAYIVGAAQGYCIAQLMDTGSTILARNRFPNADPTKRVATPTSKVSYYDKGSWFLSKSRDVCGSFDTELYTLASVMGEPSNKLGSSEVYNQIKIIQEQQAAPVAAIVNLRRGYAALAYLRGMNESLGSENLNKLFGLQGSGAPNTSLLSAKLLGDTNTALGRNSIPSSKGWDVDMTVDQITTPADIKKLWNQAQATSDSLHENAVRMVDNQFSNGTYIGTIQAASKEIQRVLLSTGWMNAGNAQATLRQLKNGSTNKINYRPYKANFALGFTPEEVAESDEKGIALNRIQTMSAVINQGVLENLPKGHPAQVTLASQLLQADLEKGSDGSNLADGMAATLAAPYHSMNTTLISMIVDENSSDDTLTRIQNFGEWLLMTIGLTLAAIIAIKLGMMLGVIAAGTASGLTLGLAKGGSVAAESTQDLVNDVLLSPLGELLDTFLLLSRIFGVVIPSMPYIFLILAGIGWFVQIIQTMFGMPLWLIMHSIPEKSFIGSQQQGYVTLLSMLFRPILIISGFYVAFDLYDPLIIYATRAFFDSYGTVSGASSSWAVSEFLIFFGSLKYWYFLYAGVLMAITYLVFGLVQELSDSVLDWLGTNLLRGFGNMDSKSTVQGISGAMAASSKSGRAAIAGRMKSRADAASRDKAGRKDTDPQNDAEQAAADGAVAGVRAANGGGGGGGGGDGGANPVVGNNEHSVNNAEAPSNVVSTDDTDHPRSADDISGLGGLGANTDNSDLDVTNTRSEVNAAGVLDEDKLDDGVLTNENIGDVKDEATGLSANQSSGSDLGGAAAGGAINAASAAGERAVGGIANGSSAAGMGAAAAAGAVLGAAAGSVLGGSGASSAGSANTRGIGKPSLESNNKLAAVAGSSGMLAGKALSARAGGLSGKAADGKGTVTSTGDGGFTATGLGSNGDITARGTVTDSGYSADLYQNQNGQEVNIGREVLSTAADGSSVTATTGNGVGDSTTITTDADNNIISQEQVSVMPNGAIQTETQDNVAGTGALSVENPDGSGYAENSNLATGAITQTQTSNSDGSVVNTVDYTPTGGSNSVATSSTLHDGVAGTFQTNTFDPQGQSTRSTIVDANGRSVTTGVANSAINANGQVVPIAPITPFKNNNSGGGNTPPSGGGDTPPSGGSGTTYGSFTRVGAQGGVSNTSGITAPSSQSPDSMDRGIVTAQPDLASGQAASATEQMDGSVSGTTAPQPDISTAQSSVAAGAAGLGAGVAAANANNGSPSVTSTAGAQGTPSVQGAPSVQPVASASSSINAGSAPQQSVPSAAPSRPQVSNVVPITQGRSSLTQSLARNAASSAAISGGSQYTATTNIGASAAPTAAVSSDASHTPPARQYTSVTAAAPTMQSTPMSNTGAVSNVGRVTSAPSIARSGATSSPIVRSASTVTAANSIQQPQFVQRGSIGAPSQAVSRQRPAANQSSVRQVDSTTTVNSRANQTTPTAPTSGGLSSMPASTATYTPYTAVNSNSLNVSDSGSRIVNRKVRVEGFKEIDEEDSITSTKSNKNPSPPPE